MIATVPQPMYQALNDMFMEALGREVGLRAEVMTLRAERDEAKAKVVEVETVLALVTE